PSSRATCVTGLPESFANRTASDLYSSLYWRRDLRSDISNLRSRYCPPYEGVHEIGGGSLRSSELFEHRVAAVEHLLPLLRTHRAPDGGLRELRACGVREADRLLRWAEGHVGGSGVAHGAHVGVEI